VTAERRRPHPTRPTILGMCRSLRGGGPTRPIRRAAYDRPVTTGHSADEATIRLDIPALPSFARLARLTAAQLARRHGFTYREVEDLRLAVDEAMVALLAPESSGATLEIRYTIRDESIEIDFTGLAAATDDQADRFDTMVADLVDERSLDRTGHNIRLLKRHQATPTAEAVEESSPPTSPIAGIS
jgi:hypothetical protein